MEASGQEARPWERRRDESAPAFAAFQVYLGLGAQRAFIGVARQLGRHKSLVYRWARRHAWRERVYQWELTQSHEAESVVRQEREDALRRQVRDAARMQRLSMFKVGSMVYRDQESGQVTLDPSVSMADAVRLYRLALEIWRAQPAAQQQAASGQAADDELDALSDPELQELIMLAQERASQSPSGGS